MVVTANQSVVDRGRLPTHDVPVLRKRRRRAQQRRRRLARIIQQTVDSESDSESDSEDELRNLYEQQQQRAQRLHRSLARKLARHATSYNMVCRPRVEFAQPKLVSPLAELTDYQMHETTRFNKAEFRMILSELTLLPRKVVTQFGCAASLELALYVLLRRWVCADRWEDIEKELRRRRSWLTDVYATTRSLLVEAYGCVVKELDFARIEPKLDEWDEIMIENSHDKLSTPGGLLFIDGKAKQDCMPGTGKAARRVARSVGCSTNLIETAFYNGYYKEHGERIHHAIDCSGMIMAYVTSIRIGDSLTYEQSGLKGQVDIVYINNDPMRPLVAIGDQAYAREEHLCPKHREASLNAMGPAQADHARAVDKANMQYRVEVEQSFNHVCTLWPFIDCVRKHKIFQGGVNNFTNLADTWYAMALITNLLTCLRGSHSTARFQIEPAGAECGLPALQAYLHSANNGLMAGQQ
jgi:hypothetical protein